MPLAKGRNEVRITLSNAIGEKAATLQLIHEGEGDLDKRGTLHIVAIGVNEYKGLGDACGRAGCDLTYSVADARGVSRSHRDAARAQPQPCRQAPPGQWRRRQACADRQQHHRRGGAAQADRGHTIPSCCSLPGTARTKGPTTASCLPTRNGWAERCAARPWCPGKSCKSAVEAAKGRRLLFVDTCHSGNAYNQRLGNAAYHANIIAYTAARFDQVALEDA